jgi:hypothetical protein
MKMDISRNLVFYIGCYELLKLKIDYALDQLIAKIEASHYVGISLEILGTWTLELIIQS